MTPPLRVELAERSYDIHFGTLESLFAAEKAAGRFPDTIVPMADLGAWEAHMPRFLELFSGTMRGLSFPAGESTKSFAQLQRMCDYLAENKVGRQAALLAVGGGVIGDLVGFAAAVYLRGVAFYQVPTTLLAMVDSSVGGKTGINIPAGKNLVGAFKQPRGVFIDTSLLETLPDREFAAGVAEIIKYGLFADPKILEALETGDPLYSAHPDLTQVIRRCLETKATIVAQDELELARTGGRIFLNLGHTFGHAIEAVAGYGEYLHGEAVAIGLHLALRLSRELGYLQDADVERYDALAQRYELPTRLNKPLSIDDLMQVMARDKKVRDHRIRFVILEAIGRANSRDDVPPDLVRRLWKEVGAA